MITRRRRFPPREAGNGLHGGVINNPIAVVFSFGVVRESQHILTLVCDVVRFNRVIVDGLAAGVNRIKTPLPSRVFDVSAGGFTDHELIRDGVQRVRDFGLCDWLGYGDCDLGRVVVISELTVHRLSPTGGPTAAYVEGDGDIKQVIIIIIDG